MDPILKKLTMKYITDCVNKYSGKKPKMVEFVIKNVQAYIDDETYANSINENMQPVESCIEQMYYLFNINGLDIDYTWEDIEVPAENIMMKFNAMKNGVSEDLTDILDI